MAGRPFWKDKQLWEMSPEEWESLCDGCARCCLVKLEDEDTGEIHFTSAACKLLDGKTWDGENPAAYARSFALHALQDDPQALAR